MGKIGIVTINGNNNFGNRLQNYALQHYLESCGFEVGTIWFTTRKAFFKEKVKRLAVYIPNLKFKRLKKFVEFTDKYINVDYWCDYKKNNDYDYFVLGSDQVWNYNYDTFSDNMFLSFSPKNRNISYAASFGVNKIDSGKKGLFYEGLKNFERISVREEEAVDIINDLGIETDVAVSLDPTMLLSSEEWFKCMKAPSAFKNKKYILLYFLGNIEGSYYSEISRIAKEKNLEIINIMDKKGGYYNVGPSEFLFLEKNASIICTDSFHSCVFSIIFGVPFVIFDRVDKDVCMSSRLNTLLSKFNLNDRRFNGIIDEHFFECDYSHAYQILEVEKKKSERYFKESLNIDFEK